MSVRCTTVSGTLLSATEFWCFLCACYIFFFLNLQSHCYRCGTAFCVKQALSCNTGGLVIARHKNPWQLLYISWHTFTPASVRTKPLIHQVRTIWEKEIRQGSDKYKETRGCVMIQGLWDRKVKAIIDVKIGNANADSYKYEPIIALLARW